ncbi:uncharacterized protein LOC143279810 [Babylonia areolata]|uniref:uncharacterized protein LOC143279810 n=1 Tax=Babylonia areolata TaxID=304850 RepID=UPI003FD48508
MATKNRPILNIRSVRGDDRESLQNRMHLTPEQPPDSSGEALSSSGCGPTSSAVDLPVEEMQRSSSRHVEDGDSSDSSRFSAPPSSLLGVRRRVEHREGQVHSSPAQQAQPALSVSIAESGLSSGTPQGSSVQAVSGDSPSVESALKVHDGTLLASASCDSDSSHEESDVEVMKEKCRMEWDLECHVSCEDSSCSPCNTSYESSIGSERNYSDHDLGQYRKGCASESGVDCVDLMYANHARLLEYVKKLPSQPKDSGICLCGEGMREPPITLRLDEGNWKYEKNKDYNVERIFRQSRKHGVFLCKDWQTSKQFVLKMVESTNNRLVGLEFLIKHCQDFLPKVLAVYKGKDTTCIFQEYIDGVVVSECTWRQEQLSQFARGLLLAVKYLHENEVAHCDLKMDNVLVRYRQRPESVVIIDFESAKSPEPCYHFVPGGHTVNYLPFWHRELHGLKEFHPKLMAADLWAVACLLLPFFSSTSTSTNKRAAIWTNDINKIQQSCTNFKNENHGNSFCGDCKGRFLLHLENEGEKMPDILLNRKQQCHSDDVMWQEMLRYLTTSSKDNRLKDASTALRFLDGTDC